MRRRTSGLTLIEVLVVVAILGLLALVLIYYLRPDDDRRVQLEAERLAVYLTETAAEAIMRDGKARAEFQLDEQTVHREYVREGAVIGAAAFERDDKDKVFKVRTPVQQTELIMPATSLKSGTGWIVFNGRQTAGGVAILELREAVYSVVVPPEGDIVVKKGRQSLPERGPPLVAREPLPSLGDLTFGSGLASLGGGALGGGAPPSPDPGTRPPPIDDDPIEDDVQPEPPDEPPPEEPVPEPPPEPPEDPPPPPDAGVDEPDAGPDDCQTANDCTEGRAEYRKCVPDEEGIRRCVIDPSGLTVKLRTVTASAGGNDLLNAAITSSLREQMTAGEFIFLVQFAYPVGTPGLGHDYKMWIVQAKPSGAQVVPHPDKPTYLAHAKPYDCGQEVCYELTPQTENLRVKVYVDQFGQPTDECEYQPLTLIARLQVRGALGEGPGTSMIDLSLTGMITENDGKRFKVRVGGQVSNLTQFMNSYNISPGGDCNGDGINDCWSFNFEGATNETYLLEQPDGYMGNVPPGCD